MMKVNGNAVPETATTSGPKPGDFPLGSIESRAAAKMLISKYGDARARKYGAELTNLTPYELALSEGVEDIDVKIQVIRLARVAEARAEAYGQRLETPEELRHMRKVAEAVNELADGHGACLRTSDPVEWNRLRQIVEGKSSTEAATNSPK